MRKVTIGIIILILAGVLCAGGILPAVAGGGGEDNGGSNNPNDPKFGNSLSFPVIWAEGVTKVLRGTYGKTTLNGEWWYQWGTNGADAAVTPASCAPDPDETDSSLNPEGLQLCDNFEDGSVDLTKVAGKPPADNPLPLAKVYLQQDKDNEWQAGSVDASAEGSTVTSVTTEIIGNELIPGTSPSDSAANVFVVNTNHPLSDGTLTGIQIYNQAKSDYPYTFNAYVLRPTFEEGNYKVIFDSGPLDVTAGDEGQIITFPVGPIAVENGDLIAHYGRGIPYITTGPDFDTVFYPANTQPTIDTQIDVALGDSTFQLCTFCGDRIYSIAAEVSTGGTVPPTTTGRVQVDMIDWGDNLESVDWYTKSKVRTEVALIEDSTVNSENDNEDEPFPMLQYEMRHLYGLGINEMWGVSTTGVPPAAGIINPNTQATVYSHCARLTIQKLLVERDDPTLADLIWVPEVGWTEPDEYAFDLINDEPILNKPVWEEGDGPSYYSAEINVKGKIIYGYNWDVKKVHDETEPAGDYRVTFSFDDYCGPTDQSPRLNTFFTDVDGNPVTQIMELAELGDTVPELSTTESDDTDGGDTGGAEGKIDYENGLTYMDVRIKEQGGG